MKHMALHLLPAMPLEWASSCVNVHLIRHPARVVASYSAKRERPTLDDIGYRRHAEMFDLLPGPVLDSADIRDRPRKMLESLCAAIGLRFDPAMLAWPAGPKPWDGAWAPHWYGAVHASTGFAGAEGPLPDLPAPEARLVAEAMPFYERMRDRALRP